MTNYSMKIYSIMLACACLFTQVKTNILFSESDNAKIPMHIDPLKPKQDVIYEWHFVELLKKIAPGINYSITETAVPGYKTMFGEYKPPHTECKISLPGNIVKEIDKLKTEYKNGVSSTMLADLFWKYLQKKGYSYYIPIVKMGFWCSTENKDQIHGEDKQNILPIIEKNKNKWDNNLSANIASYSKGSYFYVRSLHRSVLPKVYITELCNKTEHENKYDVGFPLEKFYENGWSQFNTQEFQDMRLALVGTRDKCLGVNINATIPSSFSSTPAPASIPSSQSVEPFPEVVKLVNKVPYNKNTLWAWSLFLINTTDKQVMDFLPYFIEYCRFQNPRPPLLTAFCMSLIIVRGYDYDWDTGKYQLNDMGKALLDYVVENPIPEAIWQTTILNANGCEETITAAVKKYYKLQNWNEFLDKNPKFKELSTKPVQPWLEQPASNPSTK